MQGNTWIHFTTLLSLNECMSRIAFIFPQNEALGEKIISATGSEKGRWLMRKFPDQETYVRVLSEVMGKDALIISTLIHPDEKILPLYFLASQLKKMGAISVSLLAPYLCYMRQDKEFNTGEAITSGFFGKLVSSCFDSLLTVDPHLHRWRSLEEIYSIPAKELHAAPLLAEWISRNLKSPLLIGPDRESEQWVSSVAKIVGASYVVLEKQRLGDKRVSILLPAMENLRDKTPVIIDDIISSGHTMLEVIKKLKEEKINAPVILCVHPVFSEAACAELERSAGKGKVISCNTIPHSSNQIDVSPLFAQAFVLNE